MKRTITIEAIVHSTLDAAAFTGVSKFSPPVPADMLPATW